VDLDEVPMLPGALDLVAAGVFSSLQVRLAALLQLYLYNTMHNHASQGWSSSRRSLVRGSIVVIGLGLG